MTTTVKVGSRLHLTRSALDELIQVLRKQGYSVLGPRLVDGAISLQPIESAAQLPVGCPTNRMAVLTAWWKASPS